MIECISWEEDYQKILVAFEQVLRVTLEASVGGHTPFNPTVTLLLGLFADADLFSITTFRA